VVKQKKDVQETSGELEPIAIEKATVENTRSILEDIKKCDGVIGYILRNTTSATIDLNDPSKLIDYATLSSSTFEASEKLSELFDLGKVKKVMVEGKDKKTLHMILGGDFISVFMEKDADDRKILQGMRLS
jgi:predicted regulator of Ras-like GTPase activity (Roadblock/LC7/MglB family)